MKKLLMILGTGMIMFSACSTTQNLGMTNDFEPESRGNSIEEEEQLTLF